MRKTFAILLLLSLFLSPLAAYTDSLKAFENPEAIGYLRAIKENREREETEGIVKTYLSSPSRTAAEKFGAVYQILRYRKDRGDDAGAKDALGELEKLYIEVTADPSSSPVVRTIAELDLYSARYYVSRDIGDGLKNTDITKKALKAFPDEAYLIVTDAWRLAYTPQIAGGSNKNAIKNASVLLDEADSLSLYVRHSLYGILATASFNRGEYSASKEYLEKAHAIFRGEPVLLELEEKLEKKLK